MSRDSIWLTAVAAVMFAIARAYVSRAMGRIRDDAMVKKLVDRAMTKLLHFAESQENIARVAMRLGAGVAVLGALVAVATIIAVMTK
ncbi:hypothetical protein DN412_17025 [Cupriavidus lacunae]|uniref:Uncharacterized protein n=1 Tax=Cupriavidus lacunae TaxID=2666307 RepID=A0A370NU82_9BURK|nr:hypothetical protein DN412_17025 [Cupriavidus lacunae]